MRTAASGAAAALVQMHEYDEEGEDDVDMRDKDSGRQALGGKAGPLQATAAQATTVGTSTRARERHSHSLTCQMQASSEVHLACWLV